MVSSTPNWRMGRNRLDLFTKTGRKLALTESDGHGLEISFSKRPQLLRVSVFLQAAVCALGLLWRGWLLAITQLKFLESLLAWAKRHRGRFQLSTNLQVEGIGSCFERHS